MAAPTLKDKIDANQAKAANPAHSAWVSANAGTGKTTVLVRRILNLLLHKSASDDRYTRPETILCLTYTKAAAAEMENRLFARLSQWAVMPEGELESELKDVRGVIATEADVTRARQLFARVLDTKGGLKIQTIHAFCERLLHRFPIEAGVQANFEVLDDAVRVALRDQAIDQVLGEAQRDRSAGLGRAVMEVVALTGEGRFRDIVEVALSKQEHIRQLHRFNDTVEELGAREGALIRTSLGAEGDRSENDVLADIASVLSDEQITFALEQLPAKQSARRNLRSALLDARDEKVPELRAGYIKEALLTQGGDARKTLLTKDVREAHPHLEEDLRAAQRQVETLVREHAAIEIASASGALLTLTDAIIQAYEQLKAARAALDYDDLIVRSVQLLTTSQAAAWVLYKLDWGIDHILVDEAQDTSPAQWRVIRALAEEFFSGEGARETQRTVFGVGDEKQSIYSFQGADPKSFAENGRQFAQMAEAAGLPFEPRIQLNVSFRSTEPVLQAVDHVFDRDTAARGVDWTGQGLVHEAIRAGQAGHVEVWPLEEPDEQDPVDPMRPQDEREASAHARDKLAKKIAATIKHWLDNKDLLEPRGRPITPGDILILVRSRDAFVSAMIRALKQRGIPVAGSDRMALTEQLGVMDLMALGDFVLLPDDDLTLATVLKSPLIGFDDDDLFGVGYGRSGTLWSALRDKVSEEEKYARAVAMLEGWLGLADTCPPFEFFARLLADDDMALRRALIGRLGAETADAIDEFLQLALDYERQAHPSLQGFLVWVRRAQADVKRDMEQGRDEVRIMTAHGAKGLEANIVFLPDTCRQVMAGGQSKPKLRNVLRDPTFHSAPDHLVWVPTGALELEPISQAKAREKADALEENNRLLYVAMTRAQDRLYIAGYKGEREPPADCWYRLIENGLDEHLSDAQSSLGELVRQFRTEQIVDPEDHRQSTETVQPATALPDWATAAVDREQSAVLPLTPSAIPGDAGGDASIADQDLIPPLEPANPNRFLRGTVIHALLQYLPDLSADLRESTARGFVASRARALSLAEQETIVSETLRILSDERFSALFGPGSQAEVPIVARFETDDGGVLELSGVVDRLVVLQHEVLIVDYKTNRPAAKSQDDVAPVYIRQLAAYRSALMEIYPEKTVRSILLWTDGPVPMVIDDEKLDEAAEKLCIS